MDFSINPLLPSEWDLLERSEAIAEEERETWFAVDGSVGAGLVLVRVVGAAVVGVATMGGITVVVLFVMVVAVFLEAEELC